MGPGQVIGGLHFLGTGPSFVEGVVLQSSCSMLARGPVLMGGRLFLLQRNGDWKGVTLCGENIVAIL